MAKKHSNLQTMLKLKCPRCREAGLFEDNNPYHFSKLLKMHSKCPDCGLNFIPEPGFYYGAMFLSYIMNAFLIVAVFVTYILLTPKFSELYSILYIAATIVVCAPYTYRLSRSVWLNFLVNYHKSLWE